MSQLDAEKEVEGIIDHIDDWISSLPPSLLHLARRYQEEGFPYRSAFLKNSLAFPGLHLPFWLAQKYMRLGKASQDLLWISQASVRAALFGYLYIRIQDDVYDHKEGYDPVFLLLANETIQECIEIYRNLFPGKAKFWSYYRKIWRDFSEATAWEIENFRGSLRIFEETVLPLVGQKLSFAKIPVLAVALKAGHAKDIHILFKIVDLLSTSSQLLNDFGSLERDLKTSHFTYPLSQSLRAEDVNLKENLGETMFERFLQKSSIETLFDQVLQMDQQVLEILKKFPMETLCLFIENRVKEVKEMRDRYLRIKLQSLLAVSS